jgi:Tol biopolymer transport system component
MVTGKETAVTAGPERKVRAMINPDGTKAAYVVSENNKPAIRVMTLNETGESQKLCEDCGIPISWTPDGRGLLSSRGKPIGWLLVDAATGRITDLLKHPEFDIHRLRISPDGRWLAFNPKIGPRKEPIFVARFLKPFAHHPSTALARVVW